MILTEIQRIFIAEKFNVGMSFCTISRKAINPSSPKGGVPPNGFRPGAQNRTTKR